MVSSWCIHDACMDDRDKEEDLGYDIWHAGLEVDIWWMSNRT